MKREFKTAVVTGPTGAVGTALCRELLDNGIRVFAVCRPDSPRVAALPVHPMLQVMACDISALRRLSEMIPNGADAFFHLAWAKTTGEGRNDMIAQNENVRYTLDAVAAAEALGCRVFVGAGSQAEYGRAEGVLRPDTPCFPENGYGMAKLCAGQMSRVACEQRGIDHVWARILSIYGPHDGAGSMVSSVITKLLRREKPALTAGEQLWDYLYADDAARALYLLALSGKSGKVYPLGSGRAQPLKAYIEAIRDAIDPSLPLGFGEIPYAPLQVMHLQADISALTADTGFTPDTDFAEGIRATIDCMK